MQLIPERALKEMMRNTRRACGGGEMMEKGVGPQIDRRMIYVCSWVVNGWWIEKWGWKSNELIWKRKWKKKVIKKMEIKKKVQTTNIKLTHLFAYRQSKTAQDLAFKVLR